MISAASSVTQFSRSAEPLAAQPSVWVSSLQAHGFRNYLSLDLSLENRPVVLVGPNGAGKTNIMEAVSLLAPGRGLRRAKAQMWPYTPPQIKAEPPAKTWSIAAQVHTDDGPVRAGTGTKPQEESELGRRIIKLNGEVSSQTALAEAFAVSWLTPEMDDILATSPSERRRFLDRLVIAFDPAHAGRLQRFEKLYRQRNRLIDDGKWDEDWLSALEAQMAEAGIAIIAARQSMVAALDEEAALPLPMFPSARLSLEGQAEEWLKTMPAVDVEERLVAASRNARHNGDISIPGPTSSLLVVSHSQTGQIAEMSSTGEQKALLISVILAHARLQAKRLSKPPLLLLDDIVSHLDEERRKSLFELTTSLGGQVWFSGTDTTQFKDLGVSGLTPQIISIQDGVASPKQGF